MISKLIEQIKDMIASMTSKNQLIESLTKENEALKQELQTSNSEITNLNYKIDELTLENNELRSKVAQSQKELEDYKLEENVELEQLQVAINELKALIYE